MEEDWYLQKLNELVEKTTRETALIAIREKLENTEEIHPDIIDLLLCEPDLYDILDESGGEVSADTSNVHRIILDLLWTCMSKSKADLMDEELSNLLEHAFISTHTSVRALALSAIQTKLDSSEENALSPKLLDHVMDCLKEPETTCGVAAMNILSRVLEPLLSEPVTSRKVMQMLEVDTIVKCRIYELAVIIAKRSAASLETVRFLLDDSLQNLEGEDVLLHVNVLKILESLVEEPHGIRYLDEMNVFRIINCHFRNMGEQTSQHHILVPGVMSYIVKIANTMPHKVIKGYPHMVQCLMECLRSRDVNILTAALDTFAQLAQTQEGKLLLDENFDEQLQSQFQRFANYLKTVPIEMKSRIFSMLVIVFTVPEDDQPVTMELNRVFQKWFTFLSGGENMNFLYEICSSNLHEIKDVCLRFVLTICQFDWGVNALKNTNKFIEYLLQRKNESGCDLALTKFEIIKLLAESEVFTDEIRNRLQQHVKDGPYCKPEELVLNSKFG